MSGAALLVIGDALLDRDVEGDVERLSPDAPVPVLDEAATGARPGGAGLAALLAAADGRRVTLLTALARDAAAEELRAGLDAAGVELLDVGLDGATPEKVRFRTHGRSLMRLDRGGREARVGPATAAAREAIRAADALLVSDYGRGVAAEAGIRAELGSAALAIPSVWDPHPRGPAPPPGFAVATPNEAELARAQAADGGVASSAGADGGVASSAGADGGVASSAGADGGGASSEAADGGGASSEGASERAAAARAGLAAAATRGLALRAGWGTEALCVTRGAAGALLLREGRAPLAVPAQRVAAGDACGAGDRFASALAGRLGDGASLDAAVVAAVASASAFVGAGGAGALGREAALPPPSAGGDAAATARRVRTAGGTVVATGGCFDLLHAGHVRTLEAARGLGDCLVVCLNSDESVRRLKGADRPLVSQEDRASLLAALGCVDAVSLFDEDTPAAALEAIRPHVWAKGGDYDGVELPEERVLRRWGGRAVLLPYVEGRSTTRLIEEAACRV